MAETIAKAPSRNKMPRRAGICALALCALAIGPVSNAPAISEATGTALPAPPPGGVMGFVVESFVQPVIFEPEACPLGPALKLRDAYLAGLPEPERARLSQKENEPELSRRWQSNVYGPEGTNICSQPDRFDRPQIRTVQSPRAWGLDLDDDQGQGAGGAETCQQEDFTTPTGTRGIDNQEYRVMGCNLEWRGVDGMAADQEVGMRQFMVSGEWTQVILLRGVDNFRRDDSVEVIYANTPDRPAVDSKGRFLPGNSFTISNKPPRERNVLRGRIVDGVLTTEPQDLRLTQTWGQGGARDIRGHRTRYDFRKGRLQLTFNPDGTLRGFLGGYRPVFDVIQSPALGGAGSALVAGIDCAANLATLRKYADGIKDPKTGKCTGVSSAVRIAAVPAFVNDVPNAPKTAAR